MPNNNLKKEDIVFLKKHNELRREFNDYLDKTFDLHDRVGMLKSVLTASEYAFNYETETYISEFKKFVNDKKNKKDNIIIALSELTSEEIMFEGDIIFNDDEKSVNACIPLWNISICSKFNIVEPNAETFYNMYLDYIIDKEVKISIIEYNNETKDKEYIYVPTEKEKNMLISKLEEYCKDKYNSNIKEFFEEEEEESI